MCLLRASVKKIEKHEKLMTFEINVEIVTYVAAELKNKK